jgi:uncharacterized protein (TIGR03437 family)
LRFAHFGDYGQDALTQAQLADLDNLDVLMIPAGGFFTITAAQAAAVVEQLRPRIAILMHFRTALGGPNQLAALPALASPFPNIRYKPATVDLTRALLPAATEVWVMEPVANTVVANAAGSVLGAPVAPSSLATVYGSFTGSATQSFTEFPLPRRLGTTEVAIGTQTVPLLFVSPGQVNFQVPAGLTPGQSVIEVRVDGREAGRGVITAVERAPGIFVTVDQEGRVNRARPGGFLTIYASGQGTVTPSVEDAAAAPSSPFSIARDPSVSINGRPATVTFSGLAPGFPSLWQINVRIPDDLPAGADQDLIVFFDSNLPSNAVKLTID